MRNDSAGKAIDYLYRPRTYFRPVRLERYLLSKVKGAVMRSRLQALFDEGKHDEACAVLAEPGLNDVDAAMLERIHPTFMGGNYLPETEAGEVEIARIRIASTTSDVTSVYARMEQGLIRYRVVDEYGGGTLAGDTEMKSKEPLALWQLVSFLFGAWSLVECVEFNFEDDLEGALGFFVAESEFYLDFDRACRKEVVDHYLEKREDRDAD